MQDNFKKEEKKVVIKLLFFCLLTTIISWLTAGTLTFYHANSITKKTTLNSLSSIAHSQADYLKRYFNSYKEYISSLTLNHTIANVVESLNSIGDAEKLRSESASYDAKIRRFTRLENIADIILIAPNGKVLFSLAQKQLVAINILNSKQVEPKLRNSFIQGKTSSRTISNFIPPATEQLPYCYMTARMIVDKKLAAIVVLKIDANQITSVINNTRVLGKHGKLLLCYKHNGQVYILGRSKKQTQHLKISSVSLKEKRPETFALLHKEGHGYFIISTNQQELAYCCYLPSLKIGLVTKIAKNYISYSSSNLWRWFIISGAVAMLAVIAIALVTARILIIPMRKVTREISKQSANTLRQSETKYRALFENANDGVFILQGEKFIDCNHKIVDMFGLNDKSEIINKTPLDFTYIPSDEEKTTISAKARHYISETLNGNPQRFEWQHIRKNKSKFDVEVSLTKQPFLHNNCTFAIIRDITEQKQANDVLKASEKRFFNMSQNVPGMVYRCRYDKPWTMEFISEGCLALTGYRPSELLFNRATAFNEITLPEERKKIHTQIQLAVENKRPFDIEYRILSRNGEKKWVNDRGVAVYGIGGEVSYLEGTIFDITRRKTFEKELKNAQSILESKVAERTIELKKAVKRAKMASNAKSKFLSMMSHEIKTPLNAILGFSQLMRYDNNLTESQKENIEIINHSGAHLLALIDDVLEVSKLDAKRVKLNQSVFNFHKLLNEIIAMFKVKTQEKKIWLALSIEDNIPEFIKLDAGKLRQIVINLVGNAVKFTDNGGISVNVKLNSMNNESNATKCNCCIEVKDTGCGMSPDAAKRIFSPFEQLNPKDWQEGTGLGLAISMQYAKLLGGNIVVETAEGQGSNFIFSFATECSSENQRKVKSQKILECNTNLSSMYTKAKLLIVDDNLVNARVLSELLKSLGFEISKVTGKQILLNKLKQEQFDMVFFSCPQPMSEGIAIVTEIKSVTDIPVVMTLSQQLAPKEFKEISLVSDGYIRKPYNIDEIINILKSNLSCKFEERNKNKAKEKNDEHSDKKNSAKNIEMEAQLKTELIELINAGKQSLFKDVVVASNLSSKQKKHLLELVEKFDYEEIIKLLERQ